MKIAKNRSVGLRQPAGAAAPQVPLPAAPEATTGSTGPEQAVARARSMGNFLQKAPAPRPPSPPHTYALASTPLEELADSAHEQSMSAHTMQATLRLLIVGQAPIEPWKLVGEPPRGVSRATSLRSLTSMRLTPCPVVLPRSWLSSAAAGVTIGELEVRDTVSTRRLHRRGDGVLVKYRVAFHAGRGAPAPRPHVFVKRAGRRGANSCESPGVKSALPRPRRRNDPTRRVNKSAKTAGPAATAVGIEPG